MQKAHTTYCLRFIRAVSNFNTENLIRNIRGTGNGQKVDRFFATTKNRMQIIEYEIGMENVTGTKVRSNDIC